MKTNSKDYYAARERAERMAAENATSPEAREAHEILARAYEQLAVSAPDEQRTDAERPAV